MSAHSLKWRANDLIRKRDTGEMYLVVHVYFQVCTLAIDMQSATRQLVVFLEADYPNLALDHDMRNEEKKTEYGYYNEWRYAPIVI